MKHSPVLVLSLVLAGVGCSKASSDAPSSTTQTNSAAAPAADNKSGGALVKKLVGTWNADDGSRVVDFTQDTMVSSYPKVGTKMTSKFTVQKEDGSALVIAPTLELSGGKSMKGDLQNVTFLGDDVIEMKNAKNGSGGKFTRKK